MSRCARDCAMFSLFQIRRILWGALVGFWLAGQGLSPAAGASGPVVINEVLASNKSGLGLTDPQDLYDDWIEFYNPGATAVDVGGLYVTNDLDRPMKWRFPTGHPELTTIAPQGYLLLVADGDTTSAGLHANFHLSANGDTVGLYDRNGITLIDRLTFGLQTPDNSYGRYPDGAANWEVMGWPTPGIKNLHTYAGVVAEPLFSRGRGFCDAGFTLTLSTPTDGATIYYSLDGSDPLLMLTRGIAGTKYAGPLSISHTTCVRAGAVKTGWKSSATVTASFIFLDDTLRQSASPAGFPASWGATRVDYAMDSRIVNDPAYAATIKNDLKTIPSVSVVLSNDDFFGTQRGIYANTQAHGSAWERAASIEWIDPVKKTDFQVNAGLRIHGSQYGRTASVAKHSLRILFKSDYGPSQLVYPLFDDSKVTTFDKLVLRGIWNYSWFGDSTACGGIGTSHADYLRDLFARETVRDQNWLSPRGRPVHVYLNGLYWGLYILSERPDDAFAALQLGGEKEDYDVLYADSVMNVVSGDLTAWNSLMSLAAGNLSTAQAYTAIQKYINVPQMIDYLLMVYYTGSRDTPVFLCNDQAPHNFYAVRRRTPAGPFIFLPWDLEWILEQPTVNRVTVVGQSNPHYFLNRLSANPDFRMSLADQIYQRFFNNGVLTPAECTARYLFRAHEIDRAIIGESARWGDSLRPSAPYTRTDWLAERDRLVNQYFSVRTDTVVNQLSKAGFYPSVTPPTILVNGKAQRGGHVARTDALTLTAAGGTLWYTLDNSDPRVAASVTGGTSGAVSSTALRYTAPITLGASARLKTRALNGTTWSPLNSAVFAVGPVAASLRISELMYHPANTGDASDPDTGYIELTNIGTQSINLNFVRFTAGVDFTFPSFALAPAGYCLVVEDRAAFQHKYGAGLPVAGQYAGHLSRAGEPLELQDAGGTVICRFQYRDSWFSKTDGGGYSLTVKDPVTTDPNNLSTAGTWRASNVLGGTPGRADVP